MTCSHIQRVKKLKLVKLSFFLIWPWPWSNDLDTQTWPRYDQDVPAYQKWSFYVKRFKSYSLNRQKHRQTDTQTDRHDRKRYLPTYAGGNNGSRCKHFYTVLHLVPGLVPVSFPCSVNVPLQRVRLQQTMAGPSAPVSLVTRCYIHFNLCFCEFLTCHILCNSNAKLSEVISTAGDGFAKWRVQGPRAKGTLTDVRTKPTRCPSKRVLIPQRDSILNTSTQDIHNHCSISQSSLVTM